jgi:subtilisin family serine protease
VACIVAAGNSGGPVQYPGSSPNVFTVSALGKLGEFPPQSWEAQQLSQALLSPEGFFSPAFTCFGPQVKACAPGVAVISTVPNNTFEPQSGTSMAAPHVTGMAALVLAHTPSLRSIPRGAVRVQQLFEVLRSASSPLNLGPGRTGFGLPTLHPLIPVMKAAARQAAVGRGASFEVQAASSTLSPEIVNQLGSVISDALIRAFAAAPTRAGPPVPDSPGADNTERISPEQRAKS